MEVKSENGCVVRYSETPIELPTKEKVYFKIESKRPFWRKVIQNIICTFASV